MAGPQASQARQFGVAEVTQTIGLLAGATTLVYVSGGAILSLRLNAKGLASEAVVSDLPRQFLISIGLTEVVLPLLVAGSIVTGALFAVLKLLPRLASAARALGDWSRASRIERLGLVATMAATAAAGFVATGLIFDWGALALLLVLATASVFWSAGAAIRVHFAERLTSFASVLSTGLLVAVCFTPWLVAGAARNQQLLRATVCLAGGAPMNGFLIGETTDRVYIGVAADSPPGSHQRPLIAELPRSSVRGLYIGGFSACPPAQSAA